MFPYRVKYNEFGSDIQNNNLLYKIDHQCRNAFEKIQTLKSKYKIKHSQTLFWLIYKLQNSYFIMFAIVVIFVRI